MIHWRDWILWVWCAFIGLGVWLWIALGMWLPLIVFLATGGPGIFMLLYGCREFGWGWWRDV